MIKNLPTMDDVNLTNKRVLIREDFNVPISKGKIQSTQRIDAAIPGIKKALSANAQVLLMSHLGRPEPGNYNPEFSLQPVADYLSKILAMPVKFVSNWFEPGISVDDKLVLFENVRFLPGETENSAELSKYMATLCDIFVMDAFASAHRAHASTFGVAEYASIAVAGPLLVQEVNALDKIMHNPKRPLVAIIGGAKVSTKLKLLESLFHLVDHLIIGGGMANTLLAAQGCEVGQSLCEHELIETAKELLLSAQAHDCQLYLPLDVILIDSKQKSILDMSSEDKIMDIGSNTIERYSAIIHKAATIIWNGPMGVFEDPSFARGTQKIAQAVSTSKGFSIVGGGDTVSALEQFKLTGGISYISTAGGAFLEYIEQDSLPAIKILLDRV